LRGCFSQFEDDDAGGLSPGKEEDVEVRKADRKDVGGLDVNRLYLHLGADTIVRKTDVVGIYDLDNCSASHITRDFLRRAEQGGKVVGLSEELPKSFILVETQGQITVYLSQLSTATLQKRSAAIGFEL